MLGPHDRRLRSHFHALLSRSMSYAKNEFVKLVLGGLHEKRHLVCQRYSYAY